jgi:hypothetical protein
MRNSLALAWAVALALQCGARDAAADWKKDYDLGLKAVEAGQWAEAERAFAAAIADDGTPSARKRFQGTVVKAYVPHYYAGLAAYRQGNCERALGYWRNAASSAVVAGQAELSGVQSRGIADCNQKLATTKPATTPAPAIATPTPSTTAPRPGTETTRPPAATTRPAETRPVATAPATATPPKPAPARPVETPVPAATPAPAALLGAVENYLAGRYSAVVQLDPASLPDGRSRAQAHLLRAASRFTLAQLGENEATQLDQARREVRAARAANASLVPDEAMFSPRFRAFWRDAR